MKISELIVDHIDGRGLDIDRLTIDRADFCYSEMLKLEKEISGFKGDKASTDFGRLLQGYEKTSRLWQSYCTKLGLTPADRERMQWKFKKKLPPLI